MMIAAMDRLRLRSYARGLLQNAYNFAFAQEIRRVRHAYTDGYGYDRPVRKFFEIPALVWARHSTATRALQLSQCLSASVEGTFISLARRRVHCREVEMTAESRDRSGIWRVNR